MRRSCIAIAVLLFCICMFSGCGIGGDKMIGPRSESAWKEWHKAQEELRETWGETEIYAYVQTIREDLSNVNANVVFKEDFSTETESKELEALQKLYEDMNISREISLEEFPHRLKESGARRVVGGINDLDSIKERKEEDGGGYIFILLYYPNVDSMMQIKMPVTIDQEGKFSLIELFSEVH